MTDDGIIETYGYTQGLSPEEILIQKEKMEFIITLCRDIKSVLTEKESSLFFKWALGDIGFADIGKKKITSQTRVNIRYSKKGRDNAKKKYVEVGKAIIKSILTKIRNIYDTRGYLLCKDFLLSPESNKEADVPKEQLGWMCTRLQKTNMGGRWSYNTDRKQKEYKPVIKCTVPEYLTSSFNDENTPVCSMCGIKCSRKSYFKEHNVKLKYKQTKEVQQ